MIAMDNLCVKVQQRYGARSSDNQWSHLTNSLNDVLVRRIHTKTTAGTLVASMYSLRTDDFKEAAKLRTLNLTALAAMATELNLTDNGDGIFMRRPPALSPSHAYPAETTAPPATQQQLTQNDRNLPPNPSPEPSGPMIVSERQHNTSHFNVPKFSDLTIVLSDRLVYVHRERLSSVSANFDSLLEDSQSVCTNQQYSSHRLS